MGGKFSRAENEFVEARRHFISAVREAFKALNWETSTVLGRLKEINLRTRKEQERFYAATEELARKGTVEAVRQMDNARKQLQKLQQEAKSLRKQLAPLRDQLGDVNRQLKKALGVDRALDRLDKEWQRVREEAGLKPGPARSKKGDSARQAKSNARAPAKRKKTAGKKSPARKKPANKKTRAAATSRARRRPAARKKITGPPASEQAPGDDAERNDHGSHSS